MLELIADRPETLAADLAASLGMEKAPFKRDVRKLKELGLTESLAGRLPALARGGTGAICASPSGIAR